MNIHVCTISFRHTLQSLEDIARWAAEQQFQGVELWGVHAAALESEKLPLVDLLGELGLTVPMISGYIPLDQTADTQQACSQLSQLAGAWQAEKVRTFAGAKSSQDLQPDERAHLTKQLRYMCGFFEQEGQKLLIETHPGTLADSLPSTLQLLQEVDHPNLWINFDALHVWESGADPVHAFQQLRNQTAHFHLKNISSQKQLSVFQPSNVYSPAGCRDGMVPLFDGALKYEHFLPHIPNGADVSLEWFGADVKRTLAIDSQKIKAFQHAYA